MPDNSDLFKSIVRATSNVPAEGVDAAVERVRALFVTAPAPEAKPEEAEPKRESKRGTDRQYRAGQDRSE